MAEISASIPRASDCCDIVTNPLAVLLRERRNRGNWFVLMDGKPLFSRSRECPGVIACFGRELNRRILSDGECFALPTPAASALGFPGEIVNLNRSLHSMRGTEHRLQKQGLSELLHPDFVSERSGLITRAVDIVAEAWLESRSILIMQTMRDLTDRLAGDMLFGEDNPRASRLIQSMKLYSRLRKHHSRDVVMHNGIELFTQLLHERHCNSNSGNHAALIDRLSRAKMDDQLMFSDEQLIGHINILYMSITEPISVVLSWVLLVLSQQPELSRECALEARGERQMDGGNRLIEFVVFETMRVLTPSALLTRIVTKECDVNGVELPSGAEILLCPYIAHRDPDVFSNPDVFLPIRWKVSNPSPYEYFPFGSGMHACVGRYFAVRFICIILNALLRRLRPFLQHPQLIDWKINVSLCPKDDFSLVSYPSDKPMLAEKLEWAGPVTQLFMFSSMA
jgi:cytochrome P450